VHRESRLSSRNWLVARWVSSPHDLTPVPVHRALPLLLLLGMVGKGSPLGLDVSLSAGKGGVCGQVMDSDATCTGPGDHQENIEIS
jgi:hypothetical protein